MCQAHVFGWVSNSTDLIAALERSAEGLDDEERGVMVASGQADSDGLGGAVLQEKASVVAEHGVAKGRLDADAGRAAREDEVGGAEAPEHRVPPAQPVEAARAPGFHGTVPSAASENR